MPEIVGNFFGRARNDVVPPAENVATATIVQTGTPPALGAEPIGAAEETAPEPTTDHTAADFEEPAEVEDAEDEATTEAAAETTETIEADVDEPAPAAARPAAGVRGDITLADAVLKKVVTVTAAKIDGVHSLDDDLSIEVTDDVATIRLSLVVGFGHAVRPLVARVRTAVIEAVESILGLDVAAMDVHVSDIHLTEA